MAANTTDYGYGINSNGRALSHDDFKGLRSSRLKWIDTETGKDPAYQAWLAAQPTTLDTYGSGPAWEGKDYNTAWLDTLSPEVRADYLRHTGDSKNWGDSVAKVLKVAIPLAVGGAGLAATGLFGPAAQSFVGGAPLGTVTAGATGAGAAGEVLGAGGIGGAESAAFADLAGGLLPEFGTLEAYTAGLGPTAGWATAPSLGGVVNPGYAAPSLLDTVLEKIVEKGPGLVEDLLTSDGKGGGGGFSGLSGTQFDKYTAPGLPKLKPFQASRGLLDFAQSLNAQRAKQSRGLI